ncbi:uncharacterized protein EAE98_003349 [Botrytis deweyae]|uniref:BCS1 N-terminal domain-containing protein n=1 Tax=Botrytis deweyae TaxID=2478750 RepID=A0ABQ7ITC7_9HELO|nr:uncharacterized protein EAE98_003349 [Botrytis deweyae]KAF7933640.1 hypothetical protein EAE98_003349 [Botrytis deweyae]
MENNNMTSTPQESSAITTVAIENEDQTATTSLQLPTPPTSTTMSNITLTTSTTANIAPPTPSAITMMSNITPVVAVAATFPPPGLMATFPLELRIFIYKMSLCMTVAGLLPPILLAFHGTSDYPLLQHLYKTINFVLSDATLPLFSTIKKFGNKLQKLFYLHIRSDNFEFYRLDSTTRTLLAHHNCKLQNWFRKITFTAIQPTRTPQTTDSELSEANSNIDSILSQLCSIVGASVEAPEFRVKFLGYINGNLTDQRRLDQYVNFASHQLTFSGRRWTPTRELVGDDGLVHNGIVWIWKLV